MTNTINEIDGSLVKPTFWKISHGRQAPDLINNDDNEKLLDNGFVGIGWADKPDHPQRQRFLKIPVSDYFYLVRDSSIILLGQFEDNTAIIVGDNLTISNNGREIILSNNIMIGWTFRKFKTINRLNKPFLVRDLNCREVSKAGMPSSYSTVQEVRAESLKYFVSDVLNKLFPNDLEEFKKTIPSEITSDNTRQMKMPSLNQILYGPPGTGKTYDTVSKAMKIFSIAPTDYSKLKEQFDVFKSKGRIEFVTFHQSFSYEDFVEGIRAETNDKGELNYSIKDGIFKKIAIEALYSKFEEEYAEQLDDLWQEAKSKNIYQKKITADTLFDQNNYDHKKLIVSACKIADFTAGTGDPYVLIIDEINRGNTSRIFGELITLIEDTKRAGTDEAMDALLPYSQETFTVPDNLYIIGTMNTADRSLALIDTALRRRFDFIEMMPKPELIKDINIDGINLQLMLETINDRIKALYDREHTIGHAFFMKLKKESTIEDLASIFKNKILPLLEEYFFEDWEKITQVLGKSGIYEDKTSSKEQLGFEPSGKNYSRNDDELAKAQTYINIYSANQVQ